MGCSAERASAVHGWLEVTHGAPAGDPWLRCADLDAPVLAAWEAAMTARHEDYFGRSHPAASASFVLGWYAGVPGQVGALLFLLDQRVPRLGRDALAFHRHVEFHYPDGIALLDNRFWCLPGDPAAGHPDATVLPDETALAAQLRAEVRQHADDFLTDYRPGTRLPRRSLLGAFYDGLDGGFWVEDQTVATGGEIVAAASVVLPGSTADFTDPTTCHTVVDAKGQEHLTRCRISCCYYFKLVDDHEVCMTCPRTSDAERRRRIVEAADPAGTAT